jgi:hypothetical protein
MASSKAFELAFAIGGMLSPAFSSATTEAAKKIAELNKKNDDVAKKQALLNKEFSQTLSGLGKSAGDAGAAWAKVGSSILAPVKDIMKVGAVAGAAGGAIYALAAKTAQIGDEAVKTAKKVGMTTQEYSKMAYAAGLSNVSQETLSGSLKKLNVNIAHAVKGNKESQLAFERAGVSIYGSNGKLKSTNQIMLEASDMFKKMPEGIYKADLAMALFGKSGSEMVPLMEQGSEEINRLRKEAERLGIVFDDVEGNNAAAFSDSITEAKASIQGLAIAVGKHLHPILTDITKAFSGWVVENREWIGLKAGEAVQYFKDKLPELKAFLIQTKDTIVQVITTVRDIVNYFGGWESVIKKLIIAWAAFRIGGMIFSLGSATMKTALLVNQFITAIPVIKLMGNTMLIAAKGGIAKFATALKGLTLGMWGGVRAALAFTAALLTNPIVALIAGLVALIAGLVLLYKNWDKVSAFMKETFAGVVSFFSEKIDRIKAAFSDGFLNGVVQIFKELNLFSLVNDMINKIFGIDLFGMAKSWFGKFIDGILSTISNAASIVKDAVGSLIPAPIKGAVNAVASALPKFAEGGIVTRPQVATVGEDGPELILPLNKPARMQELLSQSMGFKANTATNIPTPVENLSNAVSNTKNNNIGGASFNFSPVINISGGDQAGIENAVRNAMSDTKNYFERWYNEMKRNNERIAIA